MSHELPDTSNDDHFHPTSRAVSLDTLRSNEKSTSVEWGPSPLNAFYSPEIKEEQENARYLLEIRTRSLPDELQSIPAEIQSFVRDSFIARFTDRIMANYDNFGKRLKRDLGGITRDEIALIERAVGGDASPAELMYMRKLLGIGSIELGCLTHPYGNNIDKLDDMRSSVTAAVELFGGTLLDDEPRFSVKQADNLYMKNMTSYMHDAFLMTRKRDLAVMPDGSIVRERSSFIVRIDEASGFNQRIASNMRKIPMHDNPGWPKHIAIAGRLNEVVPPLLEDNEFSKAIPSATTIYHFDRDTIERIELRDRIERAQMFDDAERTKRRNKTGRVLGHEGVAFMRKPSASDAS